jgi:hypothetical protein
MNITKPMREDLLYKVLKDQFQEEFDQWTLQTALVVTKEKLKKDGGASEVLLSTLKSFSKSDVSLRTESQISVDGYNRFNTPRVINSYSKHDISIFRLLYIFEAKTQFVVVCDCSIAENIAIKNEMFKGKELIKKINLCKANLTSVLDACRTRKQLEQLTSLFIPFMPLPKTKTNLIPLEAVAALNLLKSPKKEAK